VPVQKTKRRVLSSRWQSMFSTASGLTEYFRTAFARDKDFGRLKAAIDFDSMVRGLPHMENPSASSRLFDLLPHQTQEIRADIRNMVQSGSATTSDMRTPQDWQATTDLIVSHYPDMLPRLATRQTAETFAEELEAVLLPFFEDHAGFPIDNITTCAL
jgi:hypothetical protein